VGIAAKFKVTLAPEIAGPPRIDPPEEKVAVDVVATVMLVEVNDVTVALPFHWTLFPPATTTPEITTVWPARNAAHVPEPKSSVKETPETELAPVTAQGAADVIWIGGVFQFDWSAFLTIRTSPTG
jgi:hypothetical protein